MGLEKEEEMQDWDGEEDRDPKAFEFRMIKMYHDWFEEEFESEELDNRTIVFLVSQLDASQPKNRVGSLCQIYRAVYLGELDRLEDLRTIVLALQDYLAAGRHRECPYTVFVALEILFFVGPIAGSEDLLTILSNIASSFPCEEVQRKAIGFLFSLSADGLNELVRLCGQEDKVRLV